MRFVNVDGAQTRVTVVFPFLFPFHVGMRERQWGTEGEATVKDAGA